MFPLRPSAPSTVQPLYSPLSLSMVFCTLLGPMSSLQPSATSTAISPLYGPLLPLRRSVPSAALYPLYDPLFLQQACPLYHPLSPTALCPLEGPLSSLRPSVSSTALCLLYGPLSPLRPSVPSMALCPLYGLLFPLRPSENSKTTSLVSLNVLQNAFRQNSKGCRDPFRISDDRTIAIITIITQAKYSAIIAK
jgi:hypothetical protein